MRQNTGDRGSWKTEEPVWCEAILSRGQKSCDNGNWMKGELYNGNPCKPFRRHHIVVKREAGSR